eukprot:30733-Eustigmatos_ZCMA.PRE.1
MVNVSVHPSHRCSSVGWVFRPTTAPRQGASGYNYLGASCARSRAYGWGGETSILHAATPSE